METETTEIFKNTAAFILGFLLASICWHFGGVDYSDRNAVSGGAFAISMLVGCMFWFGRK